MMSRRVRGRYGIALRRTDCVAATSILFHHHHCAAEKIFKKINSKCDPFGINAPSAIQSHDVILPTTTHGELRLRCIAQPDAAQTALLDRLGIELPKRMRITEFDLPVAANT